MLHSFLICFCYIEVLVDIGESVMGGPGVLLWKYQRLIAVVIFIVLAFLFFEVSGLRQGFNL
ncbi:MAG: hypothetical protein P8J55_01285 [Pseudomonadales bacterium]|nr:hypothetical protein [Pseudomonadales bacterium]